MLKAGAKQPVPDIQPEAPDVPACSRRVIGTFTYPGWTAGLPLIVRHRTRIRCRRQPFIVARRP